MEADVHTERPSCEGVNKGHVVLLPAPEHQRLPEVTGS